MKELIISTFVPHCDNGIYTLKLHLLYHVVEDIETTDNMAILDASPYEHFNVFIKQSYRSTSKRIATLMDETVTNMVSTLRKLRQNHEAQQQFQSEQSESINNLQPHLERDGASIKFQQLHSILTEDASTIESTTKKIQPFLKCLPPDGLEVFIGLVRNIVEKSQQFPSDTYISLQLVKFGFIYGGFIPTLEDYNELINFAKYSPVPLCEQQKQRVFSSTERGN